MLYVSNKFGILRVGTCNNNLVIKRERSLLHIDPQMATRTNVHLNRQDIVAYFVKAMRHYKDDKEMLVISFNTGNHWVILSISTKYDQVWYCDSSRLINSITGDRLTHDGNDVISILDE
jgi:hypothetical protein